MYKCARCGRNLKYPQFRNNKPYGKTCFEKLFGKYIRVKIEDEEKDDRRPKIRGVKWN